MVLGKLPVLKNWRQETVTSGGEVVAYDGSASNVTTRGAETERFRLDLRRARRR